MRSAIDKARAIVSHNAPSLRQDMRNFIAAARHFRPLVARALSSAQR
jgi:hypothetical protein